MEPDAPVIPVKFIYLSGNYNGGKMMAMKTSNSLLRALLLILFFNVKGFCQDSYLISTSDSIYLYYLINNRIKSIEDNIHYKEVWIRVVPGKGREDEFVAATIASRKKNGFPTKGYKEFAEKKQRWIIDIKSEKYSIVEFVDYNEKGDVLDSEHSDNYNWNSVVPGTIGEGIYKSILFRELLKTKKQELKQQKQ